MNVSNFTQLPQILRPSAAEPPRDQPITVTVARTVLPDNREAFEDWARLLRRWLYPNPDQASGTSTAVDEQPSSDDQSGRNAGLRFWEQVGQAQRSRNAAQDRTLAGLEVLAPPAR